MNEDLKTSYGFTSVFMLSPCKAVSEAGRLAVAGDATFVDLHERTGRAITMIMSNFFIAPDYDITCSIFLPIQSGAVLVSFWPACHYKTYTLVPRGGATGTGKNLFTQKI